MQIICQPVETLCAIEAARSLKVFAEPLVTIVDHGWSTPSV